MGRGVRIGEKIPDAEMARTGASLGEYANKLGNESIVEKSERREKSSDTQNDFKNSFETIRRQGGEENAIKELNNEANYKKDIEKIVQNDQKNADFWVKNTGPNKEFKLTYALNETNNIPVIESEDGTFHGPDGNLKKVKDVEYDAKTNAVLVNRESLDKELNNFPERERILIQDTYLKGHEVNIHGRLNQRKEILLDEGKYENICRLWSEGRISDKSAHHELKNLDINHLKREAEADKEKYKVLQNHKIDKISSIRLKTDDIRRSVNIGDGPYTKNFENYQKKIQEYRIADKISNEFIERNQR